MLVVVLVVLVAVQREKVPYAAALFRIAALARMLQVKKLHRVPCSINGSSSINSSTRQRRRRRGSSSSSSDTSMQQQQHGQGMW